MKKAITYILLFAYTTSVVMPVLPFVKDYVAHTFWLYEHIATVHYENGNYHTHYESDVISKNTNSEKQKDTTKSFSFAEEHTIVETIVKHNIPIVISKKNTYSELRLYLPSTIYSTEIPPPEC